MVKCCPSGLNRRNRRAQRHPRAYFLPDSRHSRSRSHHLLHLLILVSSATTAGSFLFSRNGRATNPECISLSLPRRARPDSSGSRIPLPRAFHERRTTREVEQPRVAAWNRNSHAGLTLSRVSVLSTGGILIALLPYCNPIFLSPYFRTRNWAILDRRRGCRSFGDPRFRVLEENRLTYAGKAGPTCGPMGEPPRRPRSSPLVGDRRRSPV